MVENLLISSLIAGWLTFLLAAYAVFARTGSKIGRGFPAAGLVLVIALLTYYIVARSAELGHFPAFCWRDLLVIFAWSFTVILVVTFFRRGRPVIMAGGLAPPVILLTLAVLATPREVVPESFFFKADLGLHVIVSFLGYAALWLAFLSGGFYFVLERGLKSKKVDHYLRILPPLDDLDRLFYRASGVGFILLTLCIFSGAHFLRRLTGQWWSWDPKVVLTSITWLIYAVILHQRAVIGWRGRRAMLLSLLGVLLIVMTFVGVNVLFPGHGSSLLGR